MNVMDLQACPQAPLSHSQFLIVQKNPYFSICKKQQVKSIEISQWEHEKSMHNYKNTTSADLESKS
jgi:hypothetical protein